MVYYLQLIQKFRILNIGQVMELEMFLMKMICYMKLQKILMNLLLIVKIREEMLIPKIGLLEQIWN